MLRRHRPRSQTPDQRWRMAAMSNIKRFDHAGITVDDLDSVTAFFVGLGLEVEGRPFVKGECLDTVIGIPDSRTEIVMTAAARRRNRDQAFELPQADHEPGSLAATANELG